ncbi:hypothetical protein PIB30_050697 [Stylosanthes scabra]|uniref:Uncharacterized protein n=1 Tax=Stylosanthes scabra TaxID=79078 RepID=A0ABU6TJP6_9FABA|nr:hypothetical protein [Stylosanthes scabra]
MANYRWQVGTIYASREEFKDAVAFHAMTDEDTWQLRIIWVRHTCKQVQRLGMLHSKWLGKTFKNKVEHNPKVNIKDLMAKADKK